MSDKKKYTVETLLKVWGEVEVEAESKEAAWDIADKMWDKLVVECPDFDLEVEDRCIRDIYEV